MKKTLEQYLEDNAHLRQHEAVIRETIKALKDLRAAGFADNEYDLEPPYGGRRQPVADTTRKINLSRNRLYRP